MLWLVWLFVVFTVPTYAQEYGERSLDEEMIVEQWDIVTEDVSMDDWSQSKDKQPSAGHRVFYTILSIGLWTKKLSLRHSFWIASFRWYIFISLIIAVCKIFTKAWESRWKAIIPIYNIFVLWNIAWLRKYLWILEVCCLLYVLSGLLDSVPNYDRIVDLVVGIVFAIMNFSLAKKFWWWTLWRIVSIFFPIVCYFVLWFGNYQYQWKNEKETIVEP